MSEYFANDPECHDLLPCALRSHRVAGLGGLPGALIAVLYKLFTVTFVSRARLTATELPSLPSAPCMTLALLS